MGNTISRANGTQAPASVGAPGAAGPSVNLDHLRKSNPKIEQLIAEKPGLGKLLAKNTVSAGQREGEAKTEIAWSFWTHSEGTNKKYGHGMSDKQITSDYIIAFQPSPDKNASVNLGRGAMAGQEIIGVYKVGDLIRQLHTAYDGGNLGEFDLVGHGKKGEEAILGWAIVTVGDDGTVKGGGTRPCARASSCRTKTKRAPGPLAASTGDALLASPTDRPTTTCRSSRTERRSALVPTGCNEKSTAGCSFHFAVRSALRAPTYEEGKKSGPAPKAASFSHAAVSVSSAASENVSSSTLTSASP